MFAFLFDHKTIQLIIVNMGFMAQCASYSVDRVESVHFKTLGLLVYVVDSKAFDSTCVIEFFNNLY